MTRGKGGIAGRFTDQDWVRAIRHGVRPEGRMPSKEYYALSDADLGALIAQLDAKYMPWKVLGEMIDDELKALWLYLKSLPPREYTNR